MHAKQTARSASGTPLRVLDRPGAKPIAVTIPDARRLTGLGTTTIYQLISQAKLKSVAIGRRRLVIYASIEELLQTSDEAA